MSRPIGDYDTIIITTQDSFSLSNQANIPNCAPPPPECTLNITGITFTNVTNGRGGDNGTITVGVDGIYAASTIEYILNGVVTSGGTNTTNSWTGLVAGVYQVYVEDTHGCFDSTNVTILDGEFRTGDFNVEAPLVLTAVENPVIIKVGTAINNPQPKYNVTTLAVAGTIANNVSVTFNLTSPYEYSNTFYAKGYPNKPNYFLATTLTNQYGVAQGTNTDIEIATSLAEVLQNDAVIPKVYFVNNSGAVVTLQAKETGEKFNLSSTNVISSATGVTVTQTQAGIDYCDGQLTDNYSISCEVMVNTDTTNQYPDVGTTGDYNRVAELILPFSQDNVHKFDISGILKSTVSTPMPDITLTGSTLLPTVMQPYYCRLSELYPLIPNTNTVKKRYKTETDVQWTINSSLDRYFINDMSPYLGNPATNINPNFNLTFNPYYTTQWEIFAHNYLIDSGDTGTTNIKFSIWDYLNTTIVKGWQTASYFNGSNNQQVNHGQYYMRISGITDGRNYMYSRNFYINPYAGGQDTNTYSIPTNDVEFLTNSPNPKQIQRSSNEFLYFILPKNYGFALKMRGDLYFYDGTQALNQDFFTISSSQTNAGGCMILNLSYDKLGLSNYEVSGSTNRKIKRADLAVYQSDGQGYFPYTAIKTYRFEIDEMPRKFGIIFQNALGMYDSYDMVGVVEETVSRTTDNYTVPINFSTNGAMVTGQRNIATYNTKVVKKVICNTGWIDEAHFDWLQELLKSNNIYSTSSVNQNYLNLTDFSYKKSSLDDLFDCEFTFDWTIYENTLTV